MFVSWFASDAQLLLLNVILASLVTSLAGLGAAVMAWRLSLSVRHGLLCLAVVSMLASPLAIWVGSRQGLGVLSLSWQGAASQPAEAKDGLPAGPDTDPAGGFSGGASPPSGRTGPGLPASAGIPGSDPRSRVAELPGQAWASPGAVAGGADGRPGTWGLAIWIAGSICGAGSAWRLLRLFQGWSVVRRLRRSLYPPATRRLAEAARRVAPPGRAASGLVFESRLAPAPLTLGWWRCVIVMPEGLTEVLDDEELASVLAHEAAHVARHDTLVAMAQQLAGVLFWWNPLLHLINRQLNHLRERICDTRAVHQLGDGLPLARSLVRVAEWSSGMACVPLASPLLDGSNDVERRVKRLVIGDQTAARIGVDVRSAMLLASVGLLLCLPAAVPSLRTTVAAPPPAVSPAAVNRAADAGWTVRVRVVGPDGGPVTTPRVAVQLGGGQQPAWQAGDERGTFLAKLPSRTPGSCSLLVRAKGYAPMRASWRNSAEQPADALPAEFTFRLLRAVTVGGTVVDEDGQPVAGAKVEFSAGAHAGNPAQRAVATFYREQYTTDELGQWRCDLAPESIDEASIRVAHPRFADNPETYGLDQQIGELRELKHVWTLKRGFALSGRVVDASNVPVTGATLLLCELNVSSHEGPFATSGADGRYRFERVSPQFDVTSDDPIRFTMTVIKSGFAPAQVSVPGFGGRPLEGSTREERIADVTLRAGNPLTVRVVDSENRPVAGAWVLPADWRSTTALRVLQQFGIPRETNQAGVWLWEHAPAGETIRYDVMKRGFADVRGRQIEVAQTAAEVTVVLNRPQVIRGTVVDAASRKPVGEFIVQRAFEQVSGHPDGLYWTSSATRGKDGQYRQQVVMPPHNGSYTYRVLAEGYQPAVSSSIPFTEGETELNFELRRAAP